MAVKASWTPSAKDCVDQYMVRVWLATAAQGSQPYLTIVGAKTRASLENLRPKTAYRVEVVPISKKFGLLTPVTAAITTPDSPSCNPAIKPEKPIKVKARAVAERSDSIQLLYSAPYPYKACVTGFVVGAFDAATGERVFAVTEGMEVRRTKVTGLKPATLYNIYVGALWPGGADGGSSIKLTYGNGDRSICTQHFSIDAYELKTGERVAEIETVYNAYTLTGLHRGVEYVFTVSAVNPAGDSVPDTAYCTI
ncbi:hypothetical protein OEZ86_002454 [Tetradesmus obliquus]|nr:hypothetical protein OEZ86_002454 [Tetradesmus obliquus]